MNLFGIFKRKSLVNSGAGATATSASVVADMAQPVALSPATRSGAMVWSGWRGVDGGAASGTLSGAGDYTAQVRAAYLSNAIAQRACRMIAEGVASAPLIASNPAILSLVQTTSAGQSLLETLAMHLLLHGNGYVQLLCDSRGTVQELYALRPDRISVDTDARGWPIGFVYRTGSQRLWLPMQDRDARPAIVHIRTIHPLDDHYGLGCLGAAAGAIALHNAAARWNAALMDNAARPSGALVYDAGDGSALTDDQFARLKAEMEAGFQGARNAGRPMLLEGGLRWQSMSLSPAEMDFVGARDAAAREIGTAFGVPPMLLGLTGDATYANYREASRALWRQTILPLADKILHALSQGLSPWFDGAMLRVDLDRVTALAEDRERYWAQISAADFLSADEKRALLGIQPAA